MYVCKYVCMCVSTYVCVSMYVIICTRVMYLHMYLGVDYVLIYYKYLYVRVCILTYMVLLAEFCYMRAVGRNRGTVRCSL